MAMVDIIGEIDAEISRLQQARALLSESGSGEAKRRPGRPIGSGAAKNKLTALPAIWRSTPRFRVSNKRGHFYRNPALVRQREDQGARSGVVRLRTNSPRCRRL